MRFWCLYLGSFCLRCFSLYGIMAVVKDKAWFVGKEGEGNPLYETKILTACVSLKQWKGCWADGKVTIMVPNGLFTSPKEIEIRRGFFIRPFIVLGIQLGVSWNDLAVRYPMHYVMQEFGQVLYKICLSYKKFELLKEMLCTSIVPELTNYTMHIHTETASQPDGDLVGPDWEKDGGSERHILVEMEIISRGVVLLDEKDDIDRWRSMLMEADLGTDNARFLFSKGALLTTDMKRDKVLVDKVKEVQNIMISKGKLYKFKEDLVADMFVLLGWRKDGSDGEGGEGGEEGGGAASGGGTA